MSEICRELEEQFIMDRRVSKSRRSMENAFFELLEKKSVSSITVKDICDVAEVSRSTFYDHYEDYPMFLRELEESVVNKILEILKEYNFDMDTDRMVSGMFDAIHDHRNLFAFLYDDSLNSRTRPLLEEKCKQLALPHWVKESRLRREEAELILDYMLSGSIAVMKKYYEGRVSISEGRLKEIYANIVKYGVYHYIYTV